MVCAVFGLFAAWPKDHWPRCTALFAQFKGPFSPIVCRLYEQTMMVMFVHGKL